MSQTEVARDRPLMIFDGDCGFCRFWIDRWSVKLKDRVDFKPSQEFENLPEGISREDVNQAVVFVAADGQISKGAAAVFRALSLDQETAWPMHLYESVPGVAPITEACYRVVANHRPFFSKLTKKLFR